MIGTDGERIERKRDREERQRELKKKHAVNAT